ncbi:hypothetical protein D3C71_843000 [compost metagenome]
MQEEHPGYPGFAAVQVPTATWLHPVDPSREGERVLWADGSAHGWPEREAATVTVLRRVDGGRNQVEG